MVGSVGMMVTFISREVTTTVVELVGDSVGFKSGSLNSSVLFLSTSNKVPCSTLADSIKRHQYRL